MAREVKDAGKTRRCEEENKWEEKRGRKKKKGELRTSDYADQEEVVS